MAGKSANYSTEERQAADVNSARCLRTDIAASYSNPHYYLPRGSLHTKDISCQHLLRIHDIKWPWF